MFPEITKIKDLQQQENSVFKSYIHALKNPPEQVFLPIRFYKTHKVTTGDFQPEVVFTSSGTTGTNTSRHFVKDISIYEDSFMTGFEHFYGNPQSYCFLALLPSYIERGGSSLVFMAEKLINQSNHPLSGFYLDNYAKLHTTLQQLEKEGQKTILLGVTYALLDFSEQFPMPLQHTIIMETGGMKGRRKEMVREEVHEILKQRFSLNAIHSEYGMTELLSQAYSKGDGRFFAPPWMHILIRDPYDPFTMLPTGQSGGINIIDCANIYSCAFIETQDLGKLHADGSFEILGRFDESDIRGCNLMVQ